MMQRFPLVFTAMCVSVAVIFGVRVWNLLPLYLDANVRSDVERTLRVVADRKGWLISDMELRKVTSERVVITYRRHSRRRDPSMCYHLILDDASLTPCES